MGDEPERILLHKVRHECRARWRRTTAPGYHVRGVEVKIGILRDGRWYVDLIKPDGDECRPCPDQQTARQVAEEWKRHLGGQWEQIECYPTQGWLPGEQERG